MEKSDEGLVGEVVHDEALLRRDEYLARGRFIVQASSALYIDLDVESDGKPGYGSLLSIGAVTPQGEEFYTELKPSSDRFLTSQKQFCEEHGLERERLLLEGQDIDEAVRDLDSWVKRVAKGRQPVLTAFNASFDYPWVDLAYAEAGLENPFGIAGYCLKSLAMSIRLGEAGTSLGEAYEWSKTSKRLLPESIVPSEEFSHNALEDAKYQQKLHYAMIGYLSAQAEKLQRPPSVDLAEELQSQEVEEKTPDSTRDDWYRVYYNLDINEDLQFEGKQPMWENRVTGEKIYYDPRSGLSLDEQGPWNRPGN